MNASAAVLDGESVLNYREGKGSPQHQDHPDDRLDPVRDLQRFDITHELPLHRFRIISKTPDKTVKIFLRVIMRQSIEDLCYDIFYPKDSER